MAGRTNAGARGVIGRGATQAANSRTYRTQCIASGRSTHAYTIVTTLTSRNNHGSKAGQSHASRTLTSAAADLNARIVTSVDHAPRQLAPATGLANQTSVHIQADDQTLAAHIAGMTFRRIRVHLSSGTEGRRIPKEVAMAEHSYCDGR